MFSKGLKFIEPIYHNKSKILNSIKCDLSSYVKHLSVKYSVNIKFFTPWKVNILEKVKEKLNCVKIYPKRATSIFISAKKDLDQLKEHFIITGVDKASNNISLICKKYYLDNIKHELSSTSTYSLSPKKKEDIIKDHISFCSKFKIPVTHKTLPILHMFPKFHKDSMDFRYIAAGTRSSLKPLSKILSGVLSLINKFIKTHSNYKFKFHNTSGYWIVNNKDTTLDNLSYLNNTSIAKSIKSFDLKKLYTNLSHDKFITTIF